MKRVLLTAILVSLAFCTYAQKVNEYTDSLTKVKLYFPAEVKIEKMVGFKKAEIETEKTIINIYSMLNQKGQKYTWDEVNDFDSQNAYGEIIRYERAPEELDGWIRYYRDKTKKGTPFTTCVILIRGNDYAFYMTESAYDEADLSIVEVLQTAEFPKRIKASTPFKLFKWTFALILIILPFLFFKKVKRLKNNIFWRVAIVNMACTSGFYILTTGVDWGAFFALVFSGAAWYVTHENDSCEAAVDKLVRMIDGN